MKIAGKTQVGAAWCVRTTDRKRVSRYPVPVPCRLVKLSAYMDGNGSALSGDSLHRAVVYDTAGNLLGVGSEVVVSKGQPAGWVDLPLANIPGGVVIPAAGDYDLGSLCGGVDQVSRNACDVVANAGRFNADTYSDGASNPFGSVTLDTSQLSVFATFITEPSYVGLEEMEIARLPFREAQAILGATRGVPTTLRQGVCGWHGDTASGDPETGAFAVVQPGGRFADLVGERLQVALAEGIERRHVFVYCHNAVRIADDEELSLTRRAFLALGLLAEDSLKVNVTVVG